MKLYLRTALAAFALLASSGCLFPPQAGAAWTVADNYTPAFYTASGGQTVFTIPWVFEADSDVAVKKSTDAGATWSAVSSNDYTISGAGNSAGGSVTLDTGLSAGNLLVVYRDAPARRTANFGETISSNALNVNLNRLTTWIQQVENIDYRQSIKLPLTDRVDVELPSIKGNGGKAIVASEDESGVEWSSLPLGEYSDIKSLTVTNTDGVLVSVTPANPLTTDGTLAFSLGDITPVTVLADGDVKAHGEIVAYAEGVGVSGQVSIYEPGPGINRTKFFQPDMTGNVNYYLPTDDGDAGEVLTTDGAGVLTWESAVTDKPYDIAYYQDGKPDDGQTVLVHNFARAVTCPDDFAGSYVRAEDFCDSTAVYTLKKNGSSIGTLTCDPAGGGTILFNTTGGATSFSAGNYLTVVSPSPQDADLGRVSMTLKCSRD